MLTDMTSQLKRRHTQEKIAKGFANHRRIEILELLQETPELSIFDMAEHLSVNFRTISAHTQKLVAAELVTKRYQGATVHHRITPLGASILKFLRTLG